MGEQVGRYILVGPVRTGCGILGNEEVVHGNDIIFGGDHNVERNAVIRTIGHGILECWDDAFFGW